MSSFPNQSDPAGAAVLEGFMRAMFTDIVVALARSLRELDLNLSEIAALHLLDQKGPLRIGELATALAMPMPAASRLADGLAERGLAVRKESAGDRRARMLTLSPKAAKIIARTSRERVGAAFSAALAMPGAVSETIGAALQALIERQGKPSKGKETS